MKLEILKAINVLFACIFVQKDRAKRVIVWEERKYELNMFSHSGNASVVHKLSSFYHES